MSKVIIVGAGLAGLSAAVNLIEQGHSVKIIEKSKIPGGRVKSIFYEQLGYEIDYGKHLMLGCYKETLDYIKKIDSLEQFNFEPYLNYSFFDKKSNEYKLKTTSHFYPFNLLKAIWDFNYFSSKDKLKFLLFLSKLFFIKKTKDITTDEYLDINKQYENSLKKFWNLMIVSIFNTTPNKVSANLFIKVIKEIFLSGNQGFANIKPKNNLTDLLIYPAIEYIEKYDNKIILNEAVKEIRIENKSARKLITNKNEYYDFDYLVFATDYLTTSRLFTENFKELYLENSAITNVFVELKYKIEKDKTIGFFDNEIDWIFVNENKLNIVISNSKKISELSKSELEIIVKNHLERTKLIINKNDIKNIIIQKIPNATTIIDKKIKFFKKNVDIVFRNIIFCGDWLDNQLPATIESAIKSGKIKIKKK